MKLVDRNPMGRKRGNRLVPSLTSVQREEIIKVPEEDYVGVQPMAESSRKGAFQRPARQTPPNTIYFKGDKSVTTHIETNGVYDSMKYPMSSEGIVDWKILTLKQLRRDESRTKKKEGSRQRSKNQRGIHVSISKLNRKAVSSDKMGEVSPNSEKKDYNYLRKLSTNGRLIDKIQLEMGDSNKEGIFFC